MKLNHALPFIILAVSALAAGWWLRGQLAIDRCLDNGGRWEKRGGYCEGARSAD